MAISRDDFQGIDAAWLAIDSLGQVALFTTGGKGPIPESAMASAGSAEESVMSLPEATGHELLVSVQRPDDFIAFARRGLFAYDWSDIHRTEKQAIAGYELCARPSNPLQLVDLPSHIQAIALVTRLSGVTFGSSSVLPRSVFGT